MYLEAAGYEVEEAANGVKAFARLSHRFARYLTLLDYAMPEMDGWGLMRLAAADPRLLEQHAYIVMTSEGTPFPPAFTEFLRAQVIPRVFKPIARRDLLTLLGQAEARLG
jgi:CheY-like chemotaxis protein